MAQDVYFIAARTIMPFAQRIFIISWRRVTAQELIVLNIDKMLSYRRETALQGALILDKSGRLELTTERQYFTDIIALHSTTVI